MVTAAERFYEHPDVNIRRAITFCGAEAGGAATTTYQRTPTLFKGRLRRVSAVVTTAGTTAVHGFDVFVGTLSVGAITIDTSAAGSVLVSSDLSAAVAAGDHIAVKSKTDATGKANFIAEFECTPDAVFCFG